MKEQTAPDPVSLLAWYDMHARTLPWRVPPKLGKSGMRADPYRVWLSEIMLQQTTVATVRSYFETFTERWPSISDLAATSEENVLKAWAGLGYYSRARNLKKCADMIVTRYGGQFPDTEDELLTLPGVGAYTAAAIGAIAFDRPATVVDGNVERVISRIYGVETPLPAAKKEIKSRATALTPKLRPGDYAQAMMDLGATLCSPRKPACGLCPWQKSCHAHRVGNAELLPKKAPKKKKPQRYGVAFVAVRTDGAVLLRQRPDKGLLAAMTEVPGSDWQEAFTFPTQLTVGHQAPLEGNWQKTSDNVKHTFTHFHLELEIWRSDVPLETIPPSPHWWSLPADIEQEALPTVMRKAVAAGLGRAIKARTG
ncbi:MAG: A/G-specific adenine glycosylase [Stappiaceae bacterium]